MDTTVRKRCLAQPPKTTRGSLLKEQPIVARGERAVKFDEWPTAGDPSAGAEELEQLTVQTLLEMTKMTKTTEKMSYIPSVE